MSSPSVLHRCVLLEWASWLHTHRHPQLKAENDALRNEITGGLAHMSHAEVAAAAQRLAKQEAALAAAIYDVSKRNPQQPSPQQQPAPATVSQEAMST